MTEKNYKYSMIPTIQLLGGQNYLPAVPHLDRLQALLGEYGFVVPVIIERDFKIISGCEIMLAACSLGWESVPCLFRSDVYPCDLTLFQQLAQEQLVNCEWDEIGAKIDCLTPW